MPTCSGVVLIALVACSQKRENTEFELVAWRLSSPSTEVAKVVLHVGKGAKFGLHKVNGEQ